MARSSRKAVDATSVGTLRVKSRRRKEPAPSNVDTQSTRSVSAQDRFLERVRDERNTVTVWLVRGAKLVGVIQSFDSYTVQLKGVAERDDSSRLIYKRDISAVVTSKKGAASPTRTPLSS